VLYKKSLLGKITKMINSAQVVKEKTGASHAVKVLIESESYRDVLEDSNLASWTKEFDAEFGRLSKDFQKNKTESEKFVIYEVKSKLKLQSSLSGYLAQFFPGKIIVLYQKDGGEYNFSLRRGKGVDKDLGELAKTITDGIPEGSGGGHPVAAGARIPAKQIERFLNEISKK
jgi:single-stranded DNA-specific DHH superfamily exonuclease